MAVNKINSVPVTGQLMHLTIWCLTLNWQIISITQSIRNIYKYFTKVILKRLKVLFKTTLYSLLGIVSEGGRLQYNRSFCFESYFVAVDKELGMFFYVFF